MINQWQDYGPLSCSNATMIPCIASDGERVLETNGIDPTASFFMQDFLLFQYACCLLLVLYYSLLLLCPAFAFRGLLPRLWRNAHLAFDSPVQHWLKI